LFDANTPAFLAPNERTDYHTFLAEKPKHHWLCREAGAVVGAYCLTSITPETVWLDWILLRPNSQHRGLGSQFMALAIETASAWGANTLSIATSHLSAPFFARFGAVEDAWTTDGWGPGMHRVDMRLALADSKADGLMG
jgi:GNAT superfamily N-acetyltransferase